MLLLGDVYIWLEGSFSSVFVASKTRPWQNRTWFCCQGWDMAFGYGFPESECHEISLNPEKRKLLCDWLCHKLLWATGSSGDDFEYR